MIIQLIWLKELLNKKPLKFEEYYYYDIHNYLGLTFENVNEELNTLNKICGIYFNELLNCRSKRKVKEWLDKIAQYIIVNIDVDTLIDNYFFKINNNKL